MNIVTSQEMKKIDQTAINEFGLPGNVLMAIAGKNVADFIISKFKIEDKILIAVGTGNNGGDGFVTAHFLKNHGFNVDILIIGDSKKLTESSKIYFNLCQNLQIKIWQDFWELTFSNYPIIVDAIIGIGFTGKLREPLTQIIKRINQTNSKIISVDIPSGLPSDGDAPLDSPVQANHTITMGLPKISLASFPGKIYAGEVIVADIGFPKILLENPNFNRLEFNENLFSKKFPRNKNQDSYKGENGHLLCIGGFNGMEGSIMLSSLAALEIGVGLISLWTEESSKTIIAGKIPEMMTITFPREIKQINSFIQKNLSNKKFDSLLIGPGMGREDYSQIIFNEIIANIKNSSIERIIIDGDGLFLLSNFLKTKKLPEEKKFIITPHFGEASILLEKKIDNLKKNRYKTVQELYKVTHAVSVLKGPATLTHFNNKTYFNTTGNSALATAGSGDILSGIIGALSLDSSIEILDCAGMGVFIHGKSADIFCKEQMSDIMKSSDILKNIRHAMLIENRFL